MINSEESLCGVLHMPYHSASEDGSKSYHEHINHDT